MKTLRCLQPADFWAQTRAGFSSGNPLKLELKPPTLKLPTLKVSVNPTNQQAGQAIDPKITWATTEGETKKLPIERRPPRDDQPCNLLRKFECSQFKSANKLPPAKDATKDWKTLVDSSTRAKEILKVSPWQMEARTREIETIYREGTKITIPPLLFCDKYNYLPAYLVPMTPPLTLQPNLPQESVAANESTSTQIFGVMYITLISLIDSMAPVSRPWALLGKLLSYIVKLAPILWWALPAEPAGCLPASSQENPLTGWIPER
ncbi:hypothetical protein DSO57_1000510 [Entomophthora muscae]|uniref:Uncharacterized protein n=1 Tax=Entomophthora muscae TaxID=34485 RepID=A0ACC2RPE1_9FUNG|nr:hypothetical protein DSO57_1000510 [Entomophthora muscae]